MKHRIALPDSQRKYTRFWAFVSAVVLAAGLFLLIPVTQGLQVEIKDSITYREVIVSEPAPPRPPPPVSEERPIDVDQVTELPTYEKQPPELDLKQLELSLAPGIGDAVSMGIQQIGFEIGRDVIADIEQIFEFEDLTNPPQVINASQIRIDFPPELARRGIRTVQVTMEVLIDQKGHTKVTRILSSSYRHASIANAARRAAEQARFTITRIEGREVQVRARFPLTLKAPK